MDISEVKNQLFHGIAESFEKHGFRMRSSGVAFEKIIPGGEQVFYFLVHSRGSEIFVQPRWSIKINSIADIYSRITLKSSEFFKNTVVLENNLGQLIEYFDERNETGSGKSFNYVIRDQNSIELLKKVIPIRFEEYVLPYFAQNSSVERVDLLLNTNPTKLVMHQWLNPYRVIMGVIAAKLVNSPEYKKLIDVYTEELKDSEDNYRVEFKRLITLFETNFFDAN